MHLKSTGLTTQSIAVQQVLGHNLEATITKAEGIKKEWKDDFTSVEHLVLAMLDDPRFGRKLLRDAGLDIQAIRDIRGGSCSQDQARMLCGSLPTCSRLATSAWKWKVRPARSAGITDLV